MKKLHPKILLNVKNQSQKGQKNYLFIIQLSNWYQFKIMGLNQ